MTHYSNIDVFMTEDKLKGYNSIELGGIDSVAKKIRGYEFPLEKIKIGDVEINNIAIYVTFDDRYKVSLLGMDILGHTNILIDNKNKKLKLKKLSDGNIVKDNTVFDEQLAKAREFRITLNKSKRKAGK